jgi:hydrogenase nickel incorporation protein HypA/HybF
MHELPITQHILEIVLRHAEQAKALRVTDIYLVIGQLSSYVDESIQFYWDTLCRGTVAEGAQLHFEAVKAEVECQACGARSAWTEIAQGCPECGSLRVKVVAGEEFYVRAIRVQEADEVEKSKT